jgi:hypothetical protein
MDRAAELIRTLDLHPHPEGGLFREVHRSAARVRRDDGRGGRDAATTIYYLLRAGMHSRWHRVRSDEAWHFYEGDRLEIFSAPPSCDAIHRTVLGRIGETDGPLHVINAGWWQAARPLGEYTLTGCTVAPGFEYTDFTLLRNDADALQRLTRVSATLATLA